MSNVHHPTRAAKTVRRVVFVVVSPLVELDLLGPLNVFQHAAKLQADSVGLLGGPLYEIVIAGNTSDLVLEGHCGMRMMAHQHFSQVREPIDTLLIVAGPVCVDTPVEADLCAWVRSKSAITRRMGSICVGAFVLAATGLLDGHRAATHWGYSEELARRYPNVRVDPDPIWIRDGNIFTSAGVTAGIDLALALVEEDLGSRTALEIARQLVVYLKRPGGQRQFSVPLTAQMPSRTSFSDLAAWIPGNLERTLSVEILADRMAMSPRNFARVFRSQIGLTPADYVRRVRVEAARALLEHPGKSVEVIAQHCGFGSDESMRRAFLDELGVSPAQYRATFSVHATDAA